MAWTRNRSASLGKKRNALLEQLSFLEAVEHERRVLTSNASEKNDHIKEINSSNSNNEAMHDEIINSESRDTIENISTSDLKQKDYGAERQASKRSKDICFDILKHTQKNNDASDYLIKQITASLSMQPAAPEDEIDLLFKSFATTIKTFPPPLKAETKSKIFRIISDAELQLLHFQNTLGNYINYRYNILEMKFR
ncbi:uncharacterized protein LOC126742821 [Anthonomus grandis grandis]|uniref:uncharacterized protein LOC126742821 n=1 Tax=Anthonomus grandis grandis TaxID=2921223 RepID=UPI002166A1F1|nr:uncharacterized protein LOC126742821 [Anthonomus grandis grandis]